MKYVKNSAGQIWKIHISLGLTQLFHYQHILHMGYSRFLIAFLLSPFTYTALKIWIISSLCKTGRWQPKHAVIRCQGIQHKEAFCLFITAAHIWAPVPWTGNIKYSERMLTVGTAIYSALTSPRAVSVRKLNKGQKLGSFLVVAQILD